MTGGSALQLRPGWGYGRNPREPWEDWESRSRHGILGDCRFIPSLTNVDYVGGEEGGSGHNSEVLQEPWAPECRRRGSKFFGTRRFVAGMDSGHGSGFRATKPRRNGSG